MQQIIKFHNSILLRNEMLLYYFITNENSTEITSKFLLKVIPHIYYTMNNIIGRNKLTLYFLWKKTISLLFLKKDHIWIWNMKRLTVVISSSPLESMLGGNSASRAGWAPWGNTTFSKTPLPCVLLPKR